MEKKHDRNQEEPPPRIHRISGISKDSVCFQPVGCNILIHIGLYGTEEPYKQTGEQEEDSQDIEQDSERAAYVSASHTGF